MAATESNSSLKVLRTILIFIILLEASFASANTIHVGNSFPVKSIKKAVELAQPFDSIGKVFPTWILFADAKPASKRIINNKIVRNTLMKSLIQFLP